MKKISSILLGLVLMFILCSHAGAASYSFTQTYEGVVVSGTFNVVNDTFWNSDAGYIANSSTTSAKLSDLSISFTFGGTALFNPDDYSLTAWNIFLATPGGSSVYYVGDDVFPNGYAEGFYAQFSSASGASNLYVIARLDRDVISFDLGTWTATYGPDWYGKIAVGTTSVTTLNLMEVKSLGATAVPEPATMLLLGCGLLGLAGVRRKLSLRIKNS